MSDITNPGARGALAEAAERFDRLARVVKDQQLSETRSGPRVALSDTYIASPEEAWAKKFMTQAIGPASVSSVTAPALPAFAPAVQLSQPMQGYAAAPAQQISAPARMSAVPRDLRAAGDAAQKLQAPERRRSWLGWLLLGR